MTRPVLRSTGGAGGSGEGPESSGHRLETQNPDQVLEGGQDDVPGGAQQVAVAVGHAQYRPHALEVFMAGH